MKEILYDWIRNMVFYQLLTSIIIHLVPNDVYQKYIRFFLGILFIIIAISPILEVFKLTEGMDLQYYQKMLDQELEENNLKFDVGDIDEENEENQ